MALKQLAHIAYIPIDYFLKVMIHLQVYKNTMNTVI